MKSDQFVSQAAQYSMALVLLAVLAGYVAVRECYAHHDLDIARLYFASWYVNTLSPSPFAGPGQGGRSATAVRVAFLRQFQERWARLDADYLADAYASGIRRMARYNGLEPAADTSTPARFAALQKSLITQPIPVPFVQLTVPALAAESIMCLIALILTVSVRACIWAILKDPAHGIDQPWLMLDTPTRAGGALALVWTVMTAFALPICVVACATVFTLQVAAQEIELWTPLPIAAMIVMLGTGVYGFINAAGTVVAVRRLRSKRRQAATSTKPPASNDAPLGGSE